MEKQPIGRVALSYLASRMFIISLYTTHGLEAIVFNKTLQIYVYLD